MLKRAKLYIFTIGFLLSSVVVSNVYGTEDKAAAYEYLNRIRRTAGMIPFKTNPILETSAKNHARYLLTNGIIGHVEQSNLPGFTGKKPEDRALFAGYSVRAVTENFSSGQKNVYESIDGLMSAIYHRFGFLDFSKNEIGIGIARDKQGFNFVYNMGNEQLNLFCRYSIYMKEGSFYPNICRHKDKVSAEKFDQRREKTLSSNPSIVVWPAEGADDAPVVFYEEIPDPLPDISVSGYPVSIQLNPHYFGPPKIVRFKLFRAETNEEVRPVRLLAKDSDPNHRFSEYEFALFPLRRLDWNTAYRAEAMVEVDGRVLEKEWEFRTKDLGSPIFVIQAQEEKLLVKRGIQYAVYIPPLNEMLFIERLRWESPPNLQTAVDWQDKNTILVTLSGDECEEVRFILNGDRSFRLEIAEQDNLNGNHYYPKSVVSNCVLEAIKDITGFRVGGRMEVLRMKSNRDYWIEIDSANNNISNIRWQYLEGMEVRVKHLNHNIIKVHLSGLPGQTATFFISDSKSFKIVLSE
ncbi:MAG: CAP domain-containing protein [Proteobacteria bacterium]|nr:CAP domain-containing protein [Pseudomonadota bacterium]